MYRVLKRLFDIVCALVVLALSSPLLILIAVLLILTGDHKVFSFQTRIGHKNRKIKMWRFAAMLKGNSNMRTSRLASGNRRWIALVSKYLRLARIDGIPQFINVLVGDMSIIGPHPKMEADLQYYPMHVQKWICSIKPGVIGIGSIVYRDKERFKSESSLSSRKYCRRTTTAHEEELEIWYQQYQSIRNDLWLLSIAIWTVLFHGSLAAHRIFQHIHIKPTFTDIDNMQKMECPSYVPR